MAFLAVVEDMQNAQPQDRPAVRERTGAHAAIQRMSIAELELQISERRLELEAITSQRQTELKMLEEQLQDPRCRLVILTLVSPSGSTFT